MLLVACDDSGGGGTTTTTPAATTAPSATTAPPTTVPAARYHQFGANTMVGPGLLRGTSPDGSALYVEVPDPARTSAQCAQLGTFDRFLYRVPLTGGAREEIKAGTEPVRGEMVRGPSGRIAVFVRRPSDQGAPCSGQTTLFVGTETDDGRIPDLRRVQSGELAELHRFAWSADGSRLVTFRAPARPRIDPWPVLLLDPATGTTTKAFDVDTRQLGDAAQLADGTYVVTTDDTANVTLRDNTGAVRATADGNHFLVNPQRTSVAVDGATIQLLAPGQSGPSPLVPAESGRQFTAGAFSPDGQALAYGSLGTAGERVHVVTLADGTTSTVETTGSVGAASFTGDAKSLVYNRFSAGGEQTAFAVRLGG